MKLSKQAWIDGFAVLGFDTRAIDVSTLQLTTGTECYMVKLHRPRSGASATIILRGLWSETNSAGVNQDQAGLAIRRLNRTHRPVSLRLDADGVHAKVAIRGSDPTAAMRHAPEAFRLLRLITSDFLKELPVAHMSIRQRGQRRNHELVQRLMTVLQRIQDEDKARKARAAARPRKPRIKKKGRTPSPTAPSDGTREAMALGLRKYGDHQWVDSNNNMVGYVSSRSQKFCFYEATDAPTSERLQRYSDGSD